MGAVISLENGDVKTNELLRRLSGADPISDNDPYWNKLFSFNFNVSQWSRSAQRDFTNLISELLQSLLYNAPHSNNFATLIQVFMRRCGELDLSAKCENKIFLWQAENSLLIIRYICAFFSERLTAQELASFFESRRKSLTEVENDVNGFDNNTQYGEGSVAEQFLKKLVTILCDIPVNDLTLNVHHETVRVVLCLLSTQLYEPCVTEKSLFLRFLMKDRNQATDLVRVLLGNFLHHTTESVSRCATPKTESIVISFANSMWSAFQKSVLLPVDNEKLEALDDVDAGDAFPPQTLSTLSNALLLNLVCYPSFNEKSNPFKDVLALFQNAQEVSSLINLEASFKLDFTQLYNRLCATTHEKLSMLLLYTLMHNNCGFRNFVLSRTNLENLVVPVVKVLCDGISGSVGAFRANSHHTYLSLIVLLILSEDDFFCKIVHETKLSNITWYQSDRCISEISLGGLIVLVFVKTIHTNTIKLRDRYLHTNSMAALANLSAYFKHLSPMVCQKLLALLETMTKRQAKLIRQIVDRADNTERSTIVEEQGDGEADESRARPTTGTDSASNPNNSDEVGEEAVEERSYNESLNQDIGALEEGIRNILEIINACLANNLRYNTDLIYCILYNRKLFELFRNHPFYEDLVWNIYVVINHFSARVEAHCGSNVTSQRTGESTGTGSAALSSVSAVMEAIRRTAVEWPTDRLHKFPELRFKYVEDENTLDFFVPYVWRLVWRTCGIHFNAAAVRLYNVTVNDTLGEDGGNEFVVEAEDNGADTVKPT